MRLWDFIGRMPVTEMKRSGIEVHDFIYRKGYIVIKTCIIDKSWIKVLADCITVTVGKRLGRIKRSEILQQKVSVSELYVCTLKTEYRNQSNLNDINVKTSEVAKTIHQFWL